MLMTLKDMLSQTKQKSRKAIGGIGTAIIMMMIIINNNKALTGMLPFAHLLTAALLQTHVLEKETEVQRGGVACPRSHREQAESETGVQDCYLPIYAVSSSHF